MGTHLNWTFDYRRIQPPNCDFAARLTGLLADSGDGTEERDGRCYGILPNFWFNHQEPVIAGQEEMVIGTLSFTPALGKDGNGLWRTMYYVHRKESTGGADITYEVPASDMDPDSGRISVFAVPELICAHPEGIGAIAILDERGHLLMDQRLVPIGEDTLEYGGRTHTLKGYCLTGESNPPSYWWADEEGRCVIVSTTLLTYVLGGKENR